MLNYVAASMGGELGGEWIQVHVLLSPSAVHLNQDKEKVKKKKKKEVLKHAERRPGPLFLSLLSAWLL